MLDSINKKLFQAFTSQEHSGRFSPRMLGCRSWLGVFNFYLLQLIGLRLAYLVKHCSDDREVFAGWRVQKKAPFTGWVKQPEARHVAPVEWEEIDHA